MHPTERLMHRRQVDAEINADPVRVTMERREKTSDGAGGFVWGSYVPQAPVEVLIMPAKRRMSDMLVNTELGDVVDYPFWLLARHTADIQPGDKFLWEGDTFVVKQIHIKVEASVTAQIDYFGGAKNGDES